MNMWVNDLAPNQLSPVSVRLPGMLFVMLAQEQHDWKVNTKCGLIKKHNIVLHNFRSDNASTHTHTGPFLIGHRWPCLLRIWRAFYLLL